MRLYFGPIDVDTKGLPRIYSIRVSDGSDGARVSIMLDADTRAAVDKWAKRFDVEVADEGAQQAYAGGPWHRKFAAVCQGDRYRLRVWTMVQCPAPDTATHYTTSTRAAAECGADWSDGTVSPYADEVTCPRCLALLAEQGQVDDGRAGAEPGDPAAIVHAATPIDMQRARRGVRPGPLCGQAGPFVLSGRDATCPDCLALLAVQHRGDAQHVAADATCPCGCVSATGCPCGFNCPCGFPGHCPVCDADADA